MWPALEVPEQRDQEEGSIAFLISDLMDKGYEDALKIANRKP
jgi:hypothetical protein